MRVLTRGLVARLDVRESDFAARAEDNYIVVLAEVSHGRGKAFAPHKNHHTYCTQATSTPVF